MRKVGGDFHAAIHQERMTIMTDEQAQGCTHSGRLNPVPWSLIFMSHYAIICFLARFWSLEF
jgi:hypothetical protein